MQHLEQVPTKSTGTGHTRPCTPTPATSPHFPARPCRSRYQLHQLLKVAEGKVAEASSYDPLDLFSEDPLRMLRALRALFGHPQNNLKLFWAGRPMGVRQGLRAWAAAERALGSGGSRGIEEALGASPELAATSADEEREQLLALLLEVLTQEGESTSPGKLFGRCDGVWLANFAARGPLAAVECIGVRRCGIC